MNERSTKCGLILKVNIGCNYLLLVGTFVKLQIHYDFNCVKQVPGTGKTEVIIYMKAKK